MQADLEMLVESRALVAAMVAKGMSADDIVAANPLESYESYSWGFITTERMTRTLVRSLTSE